MVLGARGLLKRLQRIANVTCQSCKTRRTENCSPIVFTLPSGTRN